MASHGDYLVITVILQRRMRNWEERLRKLLDFKKTTPVFTWLPNPNGEFIQFCIASLYIYDFSTMVDFLSEKYNGSTGHRNSWYQ